MTQSDNELGAIRKQMEFYFSDSNILRDKYLRSKMAENKDGYVDISDLLTFNRLKKLNATQESIVEALKVSKFLGVDGEKSRVRRTTPLPANSLFSTRAVFVKGWVPGSEPPTIEDVIEMFSPFGNVLRVNIRYWSDDQGRHFRGSMFVEMESSEAAERVIADEFTITVIVDGQEVERTLLTESIPDYTDRKKKETLSFRKNGRKGKKTGGNEEPQHDLPLSSENGKKNTTGSRDGKGASEDGESKHNEGVGFEGSARGGNANGQGDSEKAKEEPEEITFDSGLILRLEGLSTEVTREDIREVVEVHGDITFVDFSKGQTEGYIRFADAVSAKHAYEELTKTSAKFCGVAPKISPVEGEAEVAYWREVKNKKQNFRRKRDRDGNHRGGGRSWKRGRRSSGRGRGRNDART